MEGRKSALYYRQKQSFDNPAGIWGDWYGRIEFTPACSTGVCLSACHTQTGSSLIVSIFASLGAWNLENWEWEAPLWLGQLMGLAEGKEQLGEGAIRGKTIRKKKDCVCAGSELSWPAKSEGWGGSSPACLAPLAPQGERFARPGSGKNQRKTYLLFFGLSQGKRAGAACGYLAQLLPWLRRVWSSTGTQTRNSWAWQTPIAPPGVE